MMVMIKSYQHESSTVELKSDLQQDSGWPSKVHYKYKTNFCRLDCVSRQNLKLFFDSQSVQFPVWTSMKLQDTRIFYSFPAKHFQLV